MALFSLVLSLFPIFRHRQGHLGDELARVLVLGRAFQIGVAHRAERRQAVDLGVLDQLLPYGWKLLIRPVVVEADRPGF